MKVAKVVETHHGFSLHVGEDVYPPARLAELPAIIELLGVTIGEFSFLDRDAEDTFYRYSVVITDLIRVQRDELRRLLKPLKVGHMALCRS